MSQKATRKPEETIKNQKPAEISPIMEVKKKVTQPCQVSIERPAEKAENKPKPAEKAENKAEKPETKAKPAEKTDNKAKPADKAAEKAKDKVGEKSGEKNAEKEEKKQNGQESEKAENSAKQNGSKANGNSTPKPVPVPTTNGNGTALVEIDSSDDEVFPELTYDESDIEPTSSGRAVTRREQSKEKVLQMKDGVPERKLRSTDSPKPEVRKVETPKKDTPKKEKKEAVNGKEKEIEVVVEIENEEELSQRKTDTNFSKSRVKVSPYRRSGRLADQTTTSVQANYTGNNTTMEMDITESSFAASEQSMDDSYLSTIRNMRGRRSYKLLKDLDLTTNRSLRSNASTSVAESSSRPTAPVVGRKRKPEQDESVELAAEAGESPAIQTKRMRLLERIAQPFRRTQHTAEIVGVNTDLPLTAPIAAPSIDPETLKAAAVAPATNPSTIAAPTAAADGKRCVIM